VKKPDRRAFSRRWSAHARPRTRLPRKTPVPGAPVDPLEEWAEEKGLTNAERRVVHQCVRGLSNKEIASVLGSSAATIRTHLLTIFRKLGISSRGELAHAVFTVIESRTAELAEERLRLILELEAQRESVERERLLLDTVIQQSPLGLIVFDAAGNVVLANDVAVRVMGARPKDLAQHHELLRARHGEGRPYTFSEIPTVRALEKGETVRVELDRAGADGKKTTLEVHAAPILDRSRNVTGALGILVDVTHHKRVELELARAEQEARRALTMREDFLRVVTKDLYLPAENLSRLGASFEGLLEVSGERERARARLSIMARHLTTLSRQLSSYLRDLVALTELDSNLHLINPTALHPAALVRECLKAKNPRAQIAGVSLEVSVAPELPPVFADPDRISRALGPILDRALMVTPRGGTVAIEGKAALEGVEITIKDEGRPLPPDHEKKIFDRTWLATVGAKRGFGLGFLIAREIVERHFGRLWAESGTLGTTFHITLPPH
jgi:PAS domain S-box-containing protein